jgi:hypothetical protein
MSEKKPSYEDLLQLVAFLRRQIEALRPETNSTDASVKENALRMIDHVVPEIRTAQEKDTSEFPAVESDKPPQNSINMRETLPSLPKTAPLKKNEG